MEGQFPALHQEEAPPQSLCAGPPAAGKNGPPYVAHMRIKWCATATGGGIQKPSASMERCCRPAQWWQGGAWEEVQGRKQHTHGAWACGGVTWAHGSAMWHMGGTKRTGF